MTALELTGLGQDRCKHLDRRNGETLGFEPRPARVLRVQHLTRRIVWPPSQNEGSPSVFMSKKSSFEPELGVLLRDVPINSNPTESRDFLTLGLEPRPARGLRLQHLLVGNSVGISDIG